MAAVAQLHGLLLSPEVGAGSRPGDALELNVSNTAMSGQHLWARQVGGEGAHTKACRVIVRNLPFQVCLAHGTFALVLYNFADSQPFS